MSQGSAFIRRADDLTYFTDPEKDVDVERQLDELSPNEQVDLTIVEERLWKYPEQLIDVRGAREPVRAITFNGRLWVLYWVATQLRGNPWLCVRILVIKVLDEPSPQVPECAFELAAERYRRDTQIGPYR